MVALWPSPEAECLRRLLHARISLHATSQGVLVDMPVPVSHAGPVGPWPPEKMRTTKGILALPKGLCIGNWSFHPPLDRCAMMGLVWVWVWGAGHKLLNLLFLHTPTISEKSILLREGTRQFQSIFESLYVLGTVYGPLVDKRHNIPKRSSSMYIRSSVDFSLWETGFIMSLLAVIRKLLRSVTLWEERRGNCWVF